MFECELTNEELNALITKLLVETNDQLQWDAPMIRVTRIHTLLDLCNQLSKWKCLLSGLFELILIFWEFVDQLIHYIQAGYLVLEIHSIVLIHIWAWLKQEPNQEISFNLFNLKKLEKAILGFARKFWVSQSIKEGDENFLKIWGVLLWVDVFKLFEDIDVRLCHCEGLCTNLLYFVFQTFIYQLKDCSMTSRVLSFFL